jgi:hypothetical protein
VIKIIFMEGATTLTWASIISLFISAVVSYFVHKLLVRHVYDALKDLEELKREHENRQKAQIVAELLALWIHGPGMTEDKRKKMNELSFQCALWLPNDIYNDLSKRLTYAPDAKDIREILADVRVHLRNKAIDPKIIVSW